MAITEYQGRTFDRRPQWDERNARYLIRDKLGVLPLKGRGWQAAPLLDQGPDGTCVGHGMAGEAGATPARVPMTSTSGHDLALDIFDWAADHDPWPGDSRADGTSVLAGAQSMVERGLWDAYYWAVNATEVALAIGYEGPVVIGVGWHAGMMDTDSKGYVHVSGQEVGGHCVYVRSYSLKLQRFTLRNSWGLWGRYLTGDAYLTVADMDKLLANQGEAVCAVGRSL